MEESDDERFDDEAFKEWVKTNFEKHGLVGLVNAKGMRADYRELIGLIEYAGVDHGFDRVSAQGMGAHIDVVFDMACQCDHAREIAEKMGVQTKSVTRFCARHGIELCQPIRLVDLEDEIREHAATMSVPEIADELGFSKTAIYRFCADHDIRPVKRRQGITYSHNGYKMLWRPDHPAAEGSGYVHHINGDKLDNRPENLEVMTRSEHNAHHAQEGDTGWAKYHASKI